MPISKFERARILAKSHLEFSKYRARGPGYVRISGSKKMQDMAAKINKLIRLNRFIMEKYKINNGGEKIIVDGKDSGIIGSQLAARYLAEDLIKSMDATPKEKEALMRLAFKSKEAPYPSEKELSSELLTEAFNKSRELVEPKNAMEKAARKYKGLSDLKRVDIATNGVVQLNFVWQIALMKRGIFT